VLLLPEKVYSNELSTEQHFNNNLLRTTLFQENKHDALISQTISTNINCIKMNYTFVQNINKIRTQNIEFTKQ
jgi:hypothetical protein